MKIKSKINQPQIQIIQALQVQVKIFLTKTLSLSHFWGLFGLF